MVADGYRHPVPDPGVGQLPGNLPLILFKFILHFTLQDYCIIATCLNYQQPNIQFAICTATLNAPGNFLPS